MSHRRGAVGMSLIELLICVTIVAILSGGAYSIYSSHVRETQDVVAQASMRKLVEAVQAYNSDSAEPFTTSDPRFLIGPYLTELPQDPWGNDFVIDFFFGRVICVGPDLIINTFCPFPMWYDKVRTVVMSDDLVMEYQKVGRISCIRPGGELVRIDADGEGLYIIASSGARSADMRADGNLILYVDASGLVTFVDLSEATFEQRSLPFDPGLGVQGVSGASPGREIAWCPDGLRFAVVAETSSAPTSSVVVVAATTEAVPFILTRTSGSFTDVAWDAEGRSLFIVDAASPGTILRASASGRSAVTTYVDVGLPSPKMHVAVSGDGRYVAYDDGTNTYVLRAGTGELVKTIPGATWPCFSPDARKVAFGVGDEVESIHLHFLSDEKVQLSVFGGGGLPSHISWD